MTKIDQKRELRVMVATPHGKNGHGGIDRLNDLIFDSISSRPDLHVNVKRLTTRGKYGLFLAQFIFAFAIIRLGVAALLSKVDLLHIHLSDKGSSYRKTVLGMVAHFLRIPYVVHLHGAIFKEFWLSATPCVAGAIDRLFQRSEITVVLGRYWADVISNRLSEVRHKIVIMPNATPGRASRQVGSQSARVRISFLGQLGQRKGTPLLIEALGQLRDRSDWTATIAGDGSIEESRVEVRMLGIADRVNIPGWLDATAIDELLCRTDILVLPSNSENLPMVILEAFAHGIPVITTPVGAIPEVVCDGHNGFLIPTGDKRALFAALVQLIEHADLRESFGRAAKLDHANRYEIGIYVTRLVTLWQKVSKKNTVQPAKPTT